jgi:hypothetical protein
MSCKKIISVAAAAGVLLGATFAFAILPADARPGGGWHNSGRGGWHNGWRGGWRRPSVAVPALGYDYPWYGYGPPYGAYGDLPCFGSLRWRNSFC